MISIITINFNGCKDTCALIESLQKVKSTPIEIIVVDNNSKGDDADQIEKQFPHVIVIRSTENLGFSGGNNLGIRKAKGEYIFLLNNDTVIEEDNFSQLVSRLESSDRIGAVCPKIKFYDNRKIQYAGFTPLTKITLRNEGIGYGESDQGQYDKAYPTSFAHGAAMLIKREAIEKAGMMPEIFFLYYEEFDWSTKIINAGYEIWYDSCATILHKESQSTGQESPLKNYYLTRNRLLYAYRNLTATEFVLSFAYQAFFVAAIKSCLYVAKGKTQLAKATIKGVINFITLKNKKQCIKL